MKIYFYFAILILIIACKPKDEVSIPTTVLQMDSIYTASDFRAYGDYYKSGHQVYAIDLLSDGLHYDSTWHISGSGCNLYLSDIFAHKDSTTRLPAGTYTMDSTAREMTFLRGTSFDDNITGTYLLSIENDQIQRIILFTRGTMTIDYIDDDVVLNFHLYLADSTLYRATYTGPFTYR